MMIESEAVEGVDHFTSFESFITSTGLMCDEISAQYQKLRLVLRICIVYEVGEISVYRLKNEYTP